MTRMEKLRSGLRDHRSVSHVMGRCAEASGGPFRLSTRMTSPGPIPSATHGVTVADGVYARFRSAPDVVVLARAGLVVPQPQINRPQFRRCGIDRRVGRMVWRRAGSDPVYRSPLVRTPVTGCVGQGLFPLDRGCIQCPPFPPVP